MTTETVARIAAIHIPVPAKAWPVEVRKWAYQPGSPFAVSVSCPVMALAVRLEGNSQMIASKSQMAAQASSDPVPPRRPRPAAEDPAPVRRRSSAPSALGHTRTPRSM